MTVFYAAIIMFVYKNQYIIYQKVLINWRKYNEKLNEEKGNELRKQCARAEQIYFSQHSQ